MVNLSLACNDYDCKTLEKMTSKRVFRLEKLVLFVTVLFLIDIYCLALVAG